MKRAQCVGVDDGARRVVRVADEDQPGAVGDRGKHRVEVVGVVGQRHLHRGGARRADLQPVDLEAAPAVDDLVADGRGDLDELLAQAHRPAADRDVLGSEVDVFGQPLLQFDIAVVRVSVDGVGGLVDGRPHARQRSVHRLVACDLDRARHRSARRVCREIGQFRAQTGRHPTSLWVAELRFAWCRCGCVRCRIGGKRREACQSGRMGLTANELSPSKATGGSNPLASATQLKTSARSSTDRASDYGSEGWGFESLRARSYNSNPFTRALSGRRWEWPIPGSD